MLVKLLEYYNVHLQKAGIELNIITVNSPQELDDVVKRGDYDMVLSGWIADYYDPDSIIYPLFSRRLLSSGFANFAQLRNSRVFRLVEQARFEMNEKIRERLYGEIQSIIDREYPWIPLFYPAYAVVYNSNKVRGVRIDLMGRVHFEGER